MLLKNKKLLFFIKFLLLSFFLFSCSKKQLKISSEDLENCSKWCWIALSDTTLWTQKAEAFFTYVPGERPYSKKLTKDELLLCGSWKPIYTSSYFYEYTKFYKKQYENSDLKGNLYFCKNGSGYLEDTIFSIKNNVSVNYVIYFEWKINKNNILITPLSIIELENTEETSTIIQKYQYTTKEECCIGEINVDDKYLIQTKNWDFSAISICDSFLYKKYGIQKLKNDCIRYKYTWVEDWGEPVLQNFIIANKEFSLKELESMSFYK